MRHRLAFVAIVWAYWALVMLYALNTPRWQIPDEPAHYNYVRVVAEQAALPVLQFGDYDQAYLEAIKSRKFPSDMPIEPIRYESHQPPLYYLLAAPLYKVGDLAPTDVRLLSLRLYSALLGVVLLVLVYRIAALVCPTDRLTALLAVALVAFVPQHLAMLAGVNNDALAEVVLAGTVLGLLKIIANGGDEGGTRKFGGITPRRSWMMVGLLVGLGFLTKTTTYVSVGLFAVTLFLLWHQSRNPNLQSPFSNLRSPTRALALAFLIGSLWFARDALTYGATDWLGLARHNAVVVGQPRTLELYPNYLAAALDYFPIMFRSFWGQFGWMGVPLDPRLYDALFVFAVFALGGLALRDRRPPTTHHDSSAVRWLPSAVVLVLVAWFFFTFATTTAYSLEFFQAQGRYLFPALPAIAICLAVGLRGWVGLATRIGARVGIQPALIEWSFFGMFAITFIALDWICLYRFIVPQLR